MIANKIECDLSANGGVIATDGLVKGGQILFLVSKVAHLVSVLTEGMSVRASLFPARGLE